MVITSPLGSSRPVRGGALAARAAWLGGQGPGFLDRPQQARGTIRREGAHRALHRRVRPPTRHAKLPSRNLQGSPGRSARAAGVRTAGSPPRAVARRERVRVRQVGRGVRSSLATVAGLIPALAARCSWDRRLRLRQGEPGAIFPLTRATLSLRSKQRSRNTLLLPRCRPARKGIRYWRNPIGWLARMQRDARSRRSQFLLSSPTAPTTRSSRSPMPTSSLALSPSPGTRQSRELRL